MNIANRAIMRIKVMTGQEINWSEHRKCFGGLNKDITFYVIRRCDELAGVNSHFISAMGHIRYALRNGWIPIVDMQNYPNALLEEYEVGAKNAWEFYFKQPCNYCLEEVYNSKNVILSSGFPHQVYPNDTMEFFTRRELIQMWHRYFQKYLGFSNQLQKEIDVRYTQYFADKKGEKVLGLFLRGTDYISLRPYEHPVQPSIEMALSKTHEIIEEQGCQWVFLVTEDQSILESFQKEFRKKLFFVQEQQRFKEMLPGEHIAEHSFHRDNDRYLKGMEGLIQMGLLTKCNCLAAGRTSGSVAAMVMQPDYEYTYFWNLGRYGIDDELDKV